MAKLSYILIWHTIYYIIFPFPNYILSPRSLVRGSHTRSSCTYAKKAGTRRGGTIIYIARHARLGVFYNLPRDAISIGDRSISYGAYTHRGSRLLIHGCAGCGHVDIHARARTRTRACTREEPQGWEHEFRARTYMHLGVSALLC